MKCHAPLFGHDRVDTGSTNSNILFVVVAAVAILVFVVVVFITHHQRQRKSTGGTLFSIRGGRDHALVALLVVSVLYLLHLSRSIKRVTTLQEAITVADVLPNNIWLLLHTSKRTGRNNGFVVRISSSLEWGQQQQLLLRHHHN